MFSYDIEIIPEDKTICCSYSGTPSPEEGAKFVEAFKQRLATINVSEYAFVSNASNIIASSQDAIEITQRTMQMYLQIGFRKVIMVRPENFVSLMQYRRIATYDGVVIVDSKEEALATAKQ